VKAFQNAREITAGKYLVNRNHLENLLKTTYEMVIRRWFRMACQPIMQVSKVCYFNSDITAIDCT